MFKNTYLDMYDKPTELSEAELNYFQSVVKGFSVIMQDYFGVVLPIYNRDHDEVGGKHKNALGIFYTNDKENPLSDAYITIDNYFIHECYENVFGGVPNISFSTLEETISHEIAHGLVFRHGKKHSDLTARILRQYQALAADKTEVKKMTFKKFVEEVEKITSSYVGKVDKLAYKHIAEEIQTLIDNNEDYLFGWKSEGGVVLYDTAEDVEEYKVSTSNIGSMNILVYHIDWKPDGRSTTGGYTNKILGITVTSKLPKEFEDWDVLDIAQGLNYLLAKQHRERLMNQIKELEESLKDCKEGVRKYEHLMQTEAWDKTMLYHDMNGEE